MYRMFGVLLDAILAVSAWSAPQPTLSYGMLYVYGNQFLVQANADWHGYDLRPTHGCGLASISPAMLGRLAYVSVDGQHWSGPCLVVDVDGRDDALQAIYYRHEVAEITFKQATELGFKYGAWGYVYFGACLQNLTPERYAPPLELDYPPYSPTPSFYPYPEQEIPYLCNYPRGRIR